MPISAQRREHDTGRNRAGLCVLLAIAIVSILASGSTPLACDAGVELLITEFMALNTNTRTDENGDYSDWIEIYNPCQPSVDVGGWYLTDSASTLTKWQFPSVTLERGEFLVVYASGKDRAVAGSELHANFSLDAGGEFLALVKSNGVTIAQSFAPYYPPQHADISFGLPQARHDLFYRGDTLSYRVPTIADSALGLGWTAVGFDDSAWDAGPSGLGFATMGSPGFDVTWYKTDTALYTLASAEAVLADPLMQTDVASESSTVIDYLNTGSAGRFSNDNPFPGTTLGVNVDDFVVLVTGKIFIPAAGLWTFGISSSDGFGLELSREPHVFTSSYTGTRGAGDTLATFDIPEPGPYDARLIYYERGDGAELEFFAAQGEYSYYTSAFRLVGDTAAGGLGMADISSQVGTDVQGVMHNVNASIWSRTTFSVGAPSSLSVLKLNMNYEDGFVAYLNGGEIANRNAPFPTMWDSVSTSDRPNEDAGIAEPIDLSDYLYLLQPGPNVLAIHGMNDDAEDGAFLVGPELEAAEDTVASDPPLYFPEATPYLFNEGGYSGVSATPLFSHQSSLFVDPFSLTITADPGAVIRYTLDGSEPTETNGTVYTAPLYIDTSRRVRARVFEPGLAPGIVITRLYTMLGTDVLGFDSNLPIVIVNTFGNGITQNWFAETLTGIIPPTGGRAAITDPPDFVGYAGIRLRGLTSLGFAKKQFFLETWDEFRDDLDVGFLDFPAESDWIINGPYSDKSLMRNALAYKWSNDIGRYAVRTRFVEAYLHTSSGPITSSDYWGLYVLMEKIKRNPNRVPIARLEPRDSVAPEVTGGYIIKKDRLDPGDTGFLTSTGHRLAYVEPKEKQITTPQADYLTGYIDDFETTLYGAGFDDPVTGYAAYVDVDSFIDHHILVELTRNIDGYRLSTFFFKHRGGKLEAGPIWDYNLSFGNANYLSGWLSEGWYYSLLGSNNYPWWPRMFQDPEFELRYADRWHALRRDQLRTEKLLGDIDQFAALIDEAQQRNYVRWPVLGTYVWPNWFIANTYQEEIDWVKQWLTDRAEWMDGQLSPPPVFNHPGGLIPTNFDLTISAPAGMIYYTLDGTDPRLPGGALSAGALLYSAPLALSAPTQVIARSLDGATWSASNDATFEPIPLVFVNEVLPINLSVHSDEQGEFDPWIELYNAFPHVIDLSGLYLTDELSVPDKWSIPAGTRLCSEQWLIVWADGETTDGPLHTNFALNPAGGTVWVFDGTGFLIDSITYPALAGNVSYGRYPDGGSALIEIRYPTPGLANPGVATPVFVNEYNAVAPDGFLENFDSDSYWGLVQGNGGDWFELVVAEDHLDMRNWQVVIDDQFGAVSTTLTLGNDAVLSDLRSGTIITIAEDLASDVSYNPVVGDWWINLQAGGGGDGIYVSNLDFSVSNQSTQITVLDDSSTVVFGPAGEGVNPLSGIGSDEVFKLEEDPGTEISPLSAYNDGSSSTFGASNLWNAGASEQDFRPLRSVLTQICFADSDCYDANSCTDDVCVGYLCQNNANTAVCEDGNACTENDVCAAGQCHGEAVAGCCVSDCECDDGDPCSTDTCAANSCQYDFAPTGTACDDADLCTENDVCDLGACGGASVDCSPLDDDCNAGTCNPLDGLCEAQPANEGGSCDDADFCTTGETCSSGLCGAGAPVDCAAWDDDCNIGVCNPVDGSCESQAANEGATCDDGSLCTLGDTCAGGVCGAYVDCSSLDDACNVGVCNPTTGDCEIQPLVDGTVCDDGDACTTGDSCQLGSCTGGAPPDCDDANECTDDSCDSGTGCLNDPVTDGTTCNDGDLCTELDQCGGGVCAGSALDCTAFDDSCNTGVCDPGTGACQAEPLIDGTTCDDNVPCTDSDICTSGSCAGTPVDCTSLDDQCNTGACNAVSGVCEAQPVTDGTGCDDGDLCTELDQCAAGVCGGSALDCTGLDDQCTVGTCNPGSGVCEALPDNEGGACDDGDLCTVGETCVAGGCGVPLDCSGFDDQCNTGVCNPASGLCEAEPLLDGTSCEDGSACTTADTCQLGTCTAGPAPDCDDLNECTDDSCDPGIGCVNAPVTDGTSCDDGALCTENDSCVAGACEGTAVDCSTLDDDCNVGVCNSGTGLCDAWPVAEGTPCEDGDDCTTMDTCRVGVCTGGAPLDCSDGSLCTTDGCLDGVCVYSSSGICSISGDLRYYRGTSIEPSSKPVADVDVDASQDGLPEAVTNVSGNYQIDDRYGTVTVTALPRYGIDRAADHNEAISSLDAAFIAQFRVQQIVFSPNQQIAGDVSNNGAVSSYDAALVAQFATQLIDHFPVAEQLGSDWEYMRCDNYTDAFDNDCSDPTYFHDPLIQTEADDFYAILYGDVTGNWEPSAGGKSASEEDAIANADRLLGERLRVRAAGARRQRTRETPATLSLDGWTGRLAAGEQRELMLTLRQADGIEALDLQLGYDPEQISIVGIRPAGIGSEFSATTHGIKGKHNVAMYGLLPLEGSGPVLAITIEARQETSSRPAITVSGEANESLIPLDFEVRPPRAAPHRRPVRRTE